MASLGDHIRAATSMTPEQYYAWKSRQTGKKRGVTSRVKSAAKSVGTTAAKVATKVGRAAGGVLSKVGGVLGIATKQKAMEDESPADAKKKIVAKRRDAGYGVVNYMGEE